MKYIEEDARATEYDIPLGELIIDFYDQLKSRTQGYASLDYTFAGYEAADLVKLDILVNGAAGGCALADHAQRRGA